MSFTAWENSYVIVGSAAAALTGLMFVVIALVADSATSGRQIDAFGTPTVVHFGTVLLISAIMSAPWPQLSGARVALGLSGAAGVVYGLIVLRRARSQTDYRPVFEDWLFHTALPLVAYTSILAAAARLSQRPAPLFVIGGATVLLLFVGIHNSWDTVTYIVVSRKERRSHDEPQDCCHAFTIANRVRGPGGLVRDCHRNGGRTARCNLGVGRRTDDCRDAHRRVGASVAEHAG